MSEPSTPSTSGVHRDALAELVRPAPRMSLFRRFPSLDRALGPPARGPADGVDPDGVDPDGVDQDGVGRVRRRPPVGPRRRPVWMSAVAVVAAAVIGVGAWTVLRRPAASAGSLPHAGSDGPTAAHAGDAPGASGPAGSTSTAPSSAAAHGTDAAGGGVAGPVTVHVAGAVTRPGVVVLAAGSRAVDAVAAAGGLVVGADADRVNLAAVLVDGERLAIPMVGQPAPAEVAPQRPDDGPGSPGAVAAPIDLNSATVEQLDTLPGVGPSTAAAIVAHRDEHGPFRSVDGLLDVRGIGDAKLDALRDLVTVGGT